MVGPGRRDGVVEVVRVGADRTNVLRHASASHIKHWDEGGQALLVIGSFMRCHLLEQQATVGPVHVMLSMRDFLHVPHGKRDKGHDTRISMVSLVSTPFADQDTA